MSTCTDFSDKKQLLQAIESLEINPKYDTKKLDNEANDGYLKIFRRRVGFLYKCAMKSKFGQLASAVLDKKLAESGTITLFIDGRVGNDIVVMKSRGSWRLYKIYLPEEKFQTPSFSPDVISDLEYDDIKGHSVPNWETSLEKTNEELRWIGLAVKEMINFDNDPEGANVEESMCLMK